MYTIIGDPYSKERKYVRTIDHKYGKNMGHIMKKSRPSAETDQDNAEEQSSVGVGEV